MRLRQLELFKVIYEQRSYTKASKLLLIAQPSLSLCIKELEQEINHPLFIRKQGVIEPTTYANILYKTALSIDQALINCQHEMTSSPLKHTLYLGASITVGNTWLAKQIKQFKTLHPSTEFIITIDNAPTIETLCLQGQLDGAILESYPKSKHFYTECIANDTLVFIVHKHHPLTSLSKVTLRQISQYPLLLREHGSSIRQQVEHYFMQHQLPISISWQSSSTQSLVMAAKEDLGILILSKQQFTSLNEPTLTLLNYHDSSLTRPLCLTYPSNNSSNDVLQDFFTYIKINLSY